MQILRCLQTAVLFFVAILAATVCSQPLYGQTPDKANADAIVRSWNEAVETIGAEDEKFRELLESLKRNPPGRVVLTPEVRAAQRKRRQQLIAEIIASHEQRVKKLRELARHEQAAP